MWDLGQASPLCAHTARGRPSSTPLYHTSRPPKHSNHGACVHSRLGVGTASVRSVIMRPPSKRHLCHTQPPTQAHRTDAHVPAHSRLGVEGCVAQHLLCALAEREASHQPLQGVQQPLVVAGVQLQPVVAVLDGCTVRGREPERSGMLVETFYDNRVTVQASQQGFQSNSSRHRQCSPTRKSVRHNISTCSQLSLLILHPCTTCKYQP